MPCSPYLPTRSEIVPRRSQHFAQSGSLVDSQPGALQEYGACLMELKQTEKAIPVFQRILASHPDDPRARRGLAAVQLEAQQPKDAIATLQPLLAASNPEVSTLQLAAAAYEANKDTPNAVKTLHDAIVKDPRNVGSLRGFCEHRHDPSIVSNRD